MRWVGHLQGEGQKLLPGLPGALFIALNQQRAPASLVLDSGDVKPLTEAVNDSTFPQVVW